MTWKRLNKTKIKQTTAADMQNFSRFFSLKSIIWLRSTIYKKNLIYEIPFKVEIWCSVTILVINIDKKKKKKNKKIYIFYIN